MPAGVWAGVGVAVVALAGYAMWLLSVEAVTLKVLAAVWLAALPVIGLGAGIGWGVQAAVANVRRAKRVGCDED